MPRLGGHVARRAALVLLCCIAIAQTLVYYAYLREDPGNYNGAGAFGDQVEYIELAHQIQRGEWLGHGHYMPLYPAILAVVEPVAGDARLGAALLQAALFAGLVIGASRVAVVTFGRRTELPAAAFLALNPTLGYYAGQALTEFITGFLLAGLAASLLAWNQGRQVRWFLVAIGVAAALAYIRSEYLGLLPILGVCVYLLARPWAGVSRALARSVIFVVLAGSLMVPWIVRNAIVTGEPSLHEASPVSNLVLMGTWFRVFDEPTFTELQRIQRSSVSEEEAVLQASTVGPRPDLSARYMAQARGKYERPLGETLREAIENVRLNLPQYIYNHAVLAPVLIWAGHTPVRQADLAAIPSAVRWSLWLVQLAFVVAALWQAARLPREHVAKPLSLVFLGVALFVTAVHVVIAVDDRFTVPVLPLVQFFASGLVAFRLGAASPIRPTPVSSRLPASG